ncbi:MAG TPA: MBL fold metallo-hydrolase [Planctomycetota bacterium]|nr:MBL fold metallo-hydrolase [Planctomycetota bacterium]
MELDFRSFASGGCRTYLVRPRLSAEVALIDPGINQVDDFLRLLEREALRLTHVVDTHTHADHISAAASLADKTGCAYVMHADAPARCVTDRVSDGATIELAGVKMKVIHTPGHTRDGICLSFAGAVLTGDTLFLDDGGAGRDDLPGGDPGEHYDSLQRILTLPESTTVLPAHDYRDRPPSELARQKRSNPHLRPRSKEEFVAYLKGLCLGPAEWMNEVLKANYSCSRDPRAVEIPTEVNACEVMGSGPSTGITPVELRQRLKSKEAPVLLDVREIPELSGDLGHIPGITHIPLGRLGARVGELEPDRDREIVVICRSGVRAAAAAKFLAQAGFPKVEVLAGGMMRWRQESVDR